MSKAYPKYKSSGVAWLGDVPEHWGIKKVQFLLENNDGGVWGEDPIGDDNDSIVLRSTEQTVDGFWKIEDPAIRYLTDQEIRKAHLVEGDLVITKASGSEQHIGKTSLVNTDIEAKHCCFSNFMQRLRPNARTSSLFLWFYFNNRIVREQFVYYSNTTTGLANLNPSLIGDVQISLPPLPEQQAIAAFLDRETGRIDALITKKERLLELLAEQRTALISRAVTKGLDASVKLKPSGVEWLGDVPEHWEVKALKYLFENLDYKRIPIAAEDRSGIDKIYPYYGASGIIDYVEDYIYDETLILVAEDGANLLSRSTPLAFRAEGKYWVNNHAHILRPKYDAITYWESVLQILDYTPFVSGSAQPKLTADNLGSFLLPLPPLPEQQAIAAFLDRETAKIDALSAKVSTVIERLKEYRTALISSAVTGKIDVREAV